MNVTQWLYLYLSMIGICRNTLGLWRREVCHAQSQNRLSMRMVWLLVCVDTLVYLSYTVTAVMTDTRHENTTLVFAGATRCHVQCLFTIQLVEAMQQNKLTHTHTYPLTLILLPTHTHTHTYPLTTHTHTLTHSQHTHSHTYPLTTHTHLPTHTHSPTHTPTHNTHTHNTHTHHTLTHSLSHIHTHSQHTHLPTHNTHSPIHSHTHSYKSSKKKN